MNIKKALAYVSDYLSFLFLQNGSEKIRSVYLFGSAVRGELDKESDIDIFIECGKEDENNILSLSRVAERNFRTSKDFDKWKHFDFVYPFSVKAGELIEWELKESIESEGIILFSKEINPTNTEKVVLFIIDLPKNKKKYLAITRTLFGRKEKEYSKEGFIKINNKISSNSFLVQKSEQTNIINFLHKEKVQFRMLEFSRKI